ncbi:unnamed protein product [Dracunculus medinensis]|uniref:Peptidase A1 domain-containing protein n=1 Tax=Dracunculus medinensis TaxID=318479 RepID=A0A0N4U669_DRAME|nr:unnamed protein product [Dracunculus medinensis]
MGSLSPELFGNHMITIFGDSLSHTYLGRAQCFSVSDVFLPKMDSINALLHFATTLPTKTKITSLSVCNPFYANGFLYFIDRMNPKQAFVFKTFPDPERGFIASFQTRIARSGIITKCSVKKAAIDGSSGMPYVGDEIIWSNVQMFNNSAFFLVQDLKINTCVLWRIQLDSSTAEGNSKDYELNEIHSDKKAKSNDKFQHCPAIDTNDSNSFSYSKLSLKNNSKRKFSNSLKWQKIQEFHVSMFKLFDNSALHFNVKENYASVKGLKIDCNGKTLGHCFIAFHVQYNFENGIPSVA